jgi:hypothetical protein
MGDSTCNMQKPKSLGDNPEKVQILMESTYWKRQWVVQEMCLPRHLVFVHGSEICASDYLRDWVGNKERLCGYTPPRAPLRLLETRDKRHTELMKFESLIERFARSECSELRDRIYGLLGCANDIRPFAGRDERADALKGYMDYLSSELNPTVRPQRGMGSLRVDYTCPLYEIWVNVVGFAFFQAHSSERNATAQRVPENQNIEERQVSIVRIAGIVQEALDQKVDDERACHPKNLVDQPIC